MRFIPFAILTVSISAAGCYSDTSSTAGDTPDNGSKADNGGVVSSPMPIRRGERRLADGNESIQGGSISGNTLELEVRYGGGCETHDWELSWDGSSLESLPPEVNLELGHDSHGDGCEALLSDTLLFDLSSLGPGRVLVNIGDLQLDYNPVAAPSRPVRTARRGELTMADGTRDIVSVAYADDVLTVEVQYGGGCAAHDWELTWGGAVLESLPPQATLALGHDANDDTCEALLSDSLRFDLSGLRLPAGAVVSLGDETFIYGAQTPAPVAPPREARRGEARFANGANTITSVSADGDIVTIEVEYGGGCEAHDWELTFDSAVAEPLAPEVDLALGHNANGDACEALLSDTLRFDISPLGLADGTSVNIGSHSFVTGATRK